MDRVAGPRLGEDAVARRNWRDAFVLLTEADRRAPLDPEALERLALAAHMTGHDQASEDAWTRAHHAWLSRGEVRRAVRCVFWLALDLVTGGQWARSTGWVARARRLLAAEAPGGVEEGYLLAVEGLRLSLAGEAEPSRQVCEQVLEYATRFGDPDLENFALIGVGESLVQLGDTAGGVRLLDEAMVAVTAGEVSPVITGLAYCAVITACHELFDVRRASEWTDGLSAWCGAQQDVVPYRGVCMVHRVELLRLHGDWADALDEAEQACRWLRRQPALQPEDAALYQIGEVHRLRGEYAEAEEAYREAGRLGHPAQPGRALMLLAAGDADAAARAIRSALDAAGDHRPSRCRLLPACVEIMLAAGRTEEAAAAVAELRAAAETVAGPLLTALAGSAEGALLLAAGETGRAQAVLAPAAAAFRALGMPYEAARARLLLGLACRQAGDEVTGRLELGAATDALRELGAGPDVLRAEQLGIGAAGRAAGLLTVREREVLRHVAAGESNRAIAQGLFLSEKTVARHISNIFAKVGVGSRSAATAYAHKHGLA
ncbi:LuxR C-terminal-related transcriptional regulator [Streptomyces sp. NPDC051211]|uniref:LuxR C-terminal-related transcriptional regulator n=1 Tax=Streptomyces sp. NPDC051211 TaxID=3154643 RepID=UPI00344F0340